MLVRRVFLFGVRILGDFNLNEFGRTALGVSGWIAALSDFSEKKS